MEDSLFILAGLAGVAYWWYSKSTPGVKTSPRTVGPDQKGLTMTEDRSKTVNIKKAYFGSAEAVPELKTFTPSVIETEGPKRVIGLVK